MPKLLRIHGFGDDLIGDLIRAGLASAEVLRKIGKGRMGKVRRIRIAAAGRQELARLHDALTSFCAARTCPAVAGHGSMTISTCSTASAGSAASF